MPTPGTSVCKKTVRGGSDGQEHNMKCHFGPSAYVKRQYAEGRMLNSPAQRARGVLRSPVTALQYFFFARAGRPLGVPGRKVLPATPGKSPSEMPELFSGAQDGFGSDQEGPKSPSRRYKMAPTRRKIIPRRSRWPPEGPRGRQDDPRGPHETSQESPKRQKSPNSLRKTYIFSIFASWAFTASKSAQETPKTAQEAPKRAPRRPKRGPRRPKRPPRRPGRASGWAQ